MEDIIDVEIIDIYDGEPVKEDQISYTFKIEALSMEAIKNCRDILIGFGGTSR